MKLLCPLILLLLSNAAFGQAASLRYAQYDRPNPSTTPNYDFSESGSGSLEVTGLPNDADWNRTATCNDKGREYFFIFKQGSEDKIYICRNASIGKEIKYVSNIENGYVRLRDMPSDLDTSSFAAGYDASTERLYFFGLAEDRENVYMAEYAEVDGKANFTQSFIVPIRDAQDELDWSRWGVAWSGSIQLHVAGDDELLYVSTFDPGRTVFDFTPESRRQVLSAPDGFSESNFMLGASGGDSTVRFYLRENRVTDFLPNATNIGGGWYWNDWLGAFAGENYPWIWRDNEEGWIFGDGDADSFYYYSNKEAHWFWTAASVVPWYSDLRDGSWRGDPDAPTINNFFANGEGAGTVNISWEAEDNYQLASLELFRNEGGNVTSLGDVNGTTSFSDTEATEGNQVSYQLIARDVEGNEAEAFSGLATVPVSPSEEEAE